MEWLINNWYVIVAIIAGLAVIVAGIIAFFKLPLATQKEHIKQWLLWAVSAAERSFGGGTRYQPRQIERCACRVGGTGIYQSKKRRWNPDQPMSGE